MPSIPQPFSNLPLEGWITQLQQAAQAEDRLRALQAIGSLANPAEIAQSAANSLQDADPMLRALAAKLLANAPSPLATETAARLEFLLNDPDPDVQFEAARTLIRKNSAKDSRAIPTLLAFLDEAETQPLMVASIINLLAANSPIAGLNTTDLLPRLQQRIEHDRGEVREAVAIAFAKWPALCQSLVDQLLPLLDDSEPVVREKIAEAFGQAGLTDQKIQSALKIATQDEDTEVARVATEALQRLQS